MSANTGEYVVESIIGRRRKGERTEYLVKWKGYKSEESTWEPVRNLSKVKDLIFRFNNEMGRKKRERALATKNPAEKKTAIEEARGAPNPQV